MKPRHWLAAAAALVGVALLSPHAHAHPHVYVTVESTVLYENNTITGLRQRWYFDEFYTSMAIEGLDANGDGIYDRKELSELAKVNVDGLSQMDYFTFARLGEQKLTFDPPKDYFLDHVTLATPPGPGRALDPAGPLPAAIPPVAEAKPGFWGNLVGKLTGGKPAEPAAPKVLALEFTLPLKQPVLADAAGFEFSIADPQFWIWFDLAPDTGARLGPGAPAGCKLEIGLPKQDAGELQRLGEAFFQGAGSSGLGIAKTVSLSCPKS